MSSEQTTAVSTEKTNTNNTVQSVALSPEEEAEFLTLANQLAGLPTSTLSSTTNQTSTAAASSTASAGETSDAFSSPTTTLSSDATSSTTTAPPPPHVLPMRKYLEASILPLLTRALESLALTKPNDPLEFLSAYLLSNNPQRQNPIPVPPCAALSGWLSGAASQRSPALADEGSI